VGADRTSVAIFGAGPGLGFSAARFFGRRGWQVALVARQVDRLREFAADLGRGGITASAYAGDILDAASFDEATAAIERDLGALDVAVYQVTGPAPSVQSSLDITVENERVYVQQLLFAPIHAAHRLITPMLERGHGTVLFTIGSSALGPMPQMSQAAIPGAGLRNHLLGLAAEAAPRGVRVGILTIGGLILRSDLQRNWVPEAGTDFPGALDPDDLAIQLGDLIDADTGPERVVGLYVPGADHGG
jgi:NAD(P)-dependent dehydrogenase (short-subunit alcohol dehydrogenase family)